MTTIDMTKFIDDYLEREGITPNKAQELRYKINEGLLANQSLLFQIQNTENDNRTLIEKQLWDLWVKRSIFLDLSNSAISLLPMIKIEHPEIAKAFKIEIGRHKMTKKASSQET